MTAIGWIQIFLYCAIVVALVKPLAGIGVAYSRDEEAEA